MYNKDIVLSVITEHLPWKVEYSTRKRIGSGAFSVVYQGRCTHKKSGEVFLVAVKRTESIDANSESIAHSEAAFLGRLRDVPNVIRMFAAYKHKNSFTLCLELCETDLHAWLRGRREPAKEADICSLARQTARALQAVHARGIVHRDVKLSNLLLQANRGNVFPYVVKLSDFGLAAEETSKSSVCGTPRNMAPEILLRTAPCVNRSVDMYSFGTVLYELRTKAPPVRASTVKELREKLSDPAQAADNLYYPASASALFQALCNALLQAEPSRRPTAEEVLSHPFLNSDETETTYVIISKEQVDASTLSADTGVDSACQQQARRVLDETVRVLCAIKSATRNAQLATDRAALRSFALVTATSGRDEALRVISHDTQPACKRTRQSFARVNVHERSLVAFSAAATPQPAAHSVVCRTVLAPLCAMKEKAASKKQYAVADAISSLIADVERALPPFAECSKMPSGDALTSLCCTLSATDTVACAVAGGTQPINIPGAQKHRYCFSCGARYEPHHTMCRCGEIRGSS